MSRARVFIGIDIGKELRGKCVARQESLATAGADIKWVEPANLHLTLLFLGEVHDRALADVCRVVAHAASRYHAFTFTVDGIGCFPNPRRPRVIYAGVNEGTEDLIALHASLETPLLELGCYRREERNYRPHITLGRVRGEQSSDAISQAVAKRADWQGGLVEVREILVLNSELKQDGPEYTVLGRGKLQRA